jgi:hypothetical protein
MKENKITKLSENELENICGGNFNPLTYCLFRLTELAVHQVEGKLGIHVSKDASIFKKMAFYTAEGLTIALVDIGLVFAGAEAYHGSTIAYKKVKNILSK